MPNDTNSQPTRQATETDTTVGPPPDAALLAAAIALSDHQDRELTRLRVQLGAASPALEHAHTAIREALDALHNGNPEAAAAVLCKSMSMTIEGWTAHKNQVTVRGEGEA